MTDTDPWIPVGTLAEGFVPGASILQASSDLAGRTLSPHFDNGWVIEHRFSSLSEREWRITTDGPEGAQGVEGCLATTLRDGIYFDDFIKSGERAMSVGVIMIDLRRGKTTGKFMGYEGADFGALSNFQASAFTRILNQTTYE